MLDVNLRSVLATARVGVPALLRRPAPRSGRFIAVASAAATRGLPMLAAYCATKAGVTGLVRALAAELRGTGVTANAVSPGLDGDPHPRRERAAVRAGVGRGVRRPAAARAAARPRGGGGDARLAGRPGQQRRHRAADRRRRRPVAVSEPPGRPRLPPVRPRARTHRPARARARRAAHGRRPGAGAAAHRGRAARARRAPARRAGLAAAARALGRRLVDAGLAHPRPPAAARADRGRHGGRPGARPAARARRAAWHALGDGTPVVVVDDGSRDPAALAGGVPRPRRDRRAPPVAGGPAAARNAGAGLGGHGARGVPRQRLRAAPRTGSSALAGHFDDPLVGAGRPAGARLPGRPGAGCGRATSPSAPRSTWAREARSVRGAASPTCRRPRSSSGAPPSRDGFDPDLRHGEDVDLSLAPARRRLARPLRPGRHRGARRARSWPELLARRLRYGTSAAPLARRHPGRLASLRTRPLPGAGRGAAPGPPAGPGRRRHHLPDRARGTAAADGRRARRAVRGVVGAWGRRRPAGGRAGRHRPRRSGAGRGPGPAAHARRGTRPAPSATARGLAPPPRRPRPAALERLLAGRRGRLRCGRLARLPA